MKAISSAFLLPVVSYCHRVVPICSGRALAMYLLHCNKMFVISSGNRTPVAGPTLIFWIPWQTRFSFTYSYSSVVQSARLLVPINAHIMWWPRCSIDQVSSSEPWQPKRRQNIITALTTLPQEWVSAFKHQCTTAITTMWAESSWAFPESYTARTCTQVMADNGDTKGLITPPPKWVSAQLLYVCVTTWWRSRGVVKIFVALSCRQWGYLHYLHYKSGNRTPGSRFYSDLLDTLADFVCIHQLMLVSFKALGCSYNCMRLTCGSFQLTHMSRDDQAVQLIEQRRQNITALTTLPQGWVSTHKHQCTRAITTMWAESSWAFPESYTTGSCARAMADNRETKGLLTPPPRWVSAQSLYVTVW